MGYKLNPDLWNSVLVVPTSVVDEHLRRVSGQQLKALLYLLRWNGQSPSIEQMAKDIGLSVEDTKDALSYWVETGYLYQDGAAPAPLTTAKEETPLTDIPDVAPTHETVAARILESPEIKELFNEAQLRLGKTIGYDTQAKLLMMIDSYGLPPEVILTIIEYSVSHGKNSIAYICKVGKNWAEDGVDSLEAAEERLRSLDQAEKLWKDFAAQFAVDAPKATTSRVNFLKKWRLTWQQSNDLIFYAYEQMINNINKINFNYLDKILENWYSHGWKTPQDVLQQDKPELPEKSRKTASQKTVSYDSDAYRKKARGPIEYKRRDD